MRAYRNGTRSDIPVKNLMGKRRRYMNNEVMGTSSFGPVLDKPEPAQDVLKTVVDDLLV